MDQALKKELARDTDGLLTYEYMANHIADCGNILPDLVDNMIAVDSTGQFMVSAARYLSAIDRKGFATQIDRLVACAIERDREHRYIGDLLPSLWGDNYADEAEKLYMTDNNFRRIYKRIHPGGVI